MAYDGLAVPQGGFIGYVEEYHVMGMSEENYRACGDAFLDFDCVEKPLHGDEDGGYSSSLRIAIVETL